MNTNGRSGVKPESPGWMGVSCLVGSGLDVAEKGLGTL